MKLELMATINEDGTVSLHVDSNEVMGTLTLNTMGNHFESLFIKGRIKSGDTVYMEMRLTPWGG